MLCESEELPRVVRMCEVDVFPVEANGTVPGTFTLLEGGDEAAVVVLQMAGEPVVVIDHGSVAWMDYDLTREPQPRVLGSERG